MSASVNLEIHICPFCQRELATGIDSFGRPRICNRCVVERVRQLHALATDGPKRVRRVTSRSVRMAAVLATLLFTAAWLWALERFL